MRRKILIRHGSNSEIVIEESANITRCKPWEISEKFSDIDHFISDCHIQFLTSMEADGFLHSVFDGLQLDGKLELHVPDLDFFARQWIDAVWDELLLRDIHSQARRSFAGLFGWQQNGNPLLPGYDPEHGDCHRSGYNVRRLEFLLLGTLADNQEPRIFVPEKSPFPVNGGQKASKVLGSRQAR